MILLTLLYPLFSVSIQQKNFKLYSISPLLLSLSNLTIKGNGYPLISSTLLNIYSNHPIFLGIPKHSPIEISLQSLHFKLMTSSLIQGSFSRVTLDSIQVDNAKLINEHCTDLININTSDCLPVFYNCNVTIRNCRIENFFPSTGSNKSPSIRSSVIQSYDANIDIDHSSFLFCNSNTSPVLFSALSNINFFYSNFSFNYGEAEGVFSMIHSTGSAKSCFFGNNEAHENGVCSISESIFNFNSNAIVHNRADINSIVYLLLANSTLSNNYFVANRIQSIFYGIVSIYDDLKTSTNVSFIRCIFSLNKEIEDITENENSKSQLTKSNKNEINSHFTPNKKKVPYSGKSVYSIFYRGDDSINLDHCTFDTDYDQSIIVFDGGSFIDMNSSFGKSVETPYDIFDTIPFVDSRGFRMDFEASKSVLYSVCILSLVLVVISIVTYFLNQISSIFF